MKCFIYILISVVFFAGCTKKQEKKENYGLVGKWKLAETFISPGAGGSWQPYSSAAPVIIEFTSGGNFNYSSNFPKASLQFNQYSLSGSSVNMSSSANSNADTWYIHYLDNTRLDISIYTCFEGCAYRFVAF
jgi:hypothetical protein